MITTGINLAVLITCHNRREKTLRCLKSLLAQRQVKDQRSEVEQWNIHIFLVDDGSTDGTSGAARKEMENIDAPWKLHLIQGNGRLFWARGMALAWQSALNCEKDQSHCSPPSLAFTFSHFLWLNDDVELSSDALDKLFNIVQPSTSHLQPVVIGEICDPVDGSLKTYGVQGRWFNGNVVLVPRAVYEKVGMIDGSYAHAKADYDYAERVRCAGLGVVATDGFVGTCRADWLGRFRGHGLFRRLHMMFEPCYWNLHDLWRFRMKYYGPVAAVASCARLVWIVVKGVS